MDGPKVQGPISTANGVLVLSHIHMGGSMRTACATCRTHRGETQGVQGSDTDRTLHPQP